MNLSRLRARLLHRIHRTYSTLTQPLEIGRVKLDFTRIEDPDRVLDQVAAEEDRLEKHRGRRVSEDELHLPYWAELWDSAVAMGHFLAGQAGETAPANMLDLGCGMGLAGTVAAALGHRVLFVDLEKPPLLFASLNSLPWRERVRTRQANWRTDNLRETFDVILGADILYERAQWNYLESFWRAHLRGGGQVLLGEPGRQTGDLFPDWIASRGWRLDRFEQQIPTRPRPVRIFRLRLEAGAK